MRYAFLISVFALIGLWSLIRSPFYTSHDGFTHTARIAAYYRDLAEGQWPPRWATNFNGGLGSPIFVYSYPLPYFLGAALHFTGLHYQDIYRLVLGGAFLLSGLAAFWWLSNRFGGLAGLVGAVFYLWVPYRFLNIYVRGAYAESFAYIFAPVIFLAIEKLFGMRKGRRWWYVLALGTAGLLLSHNVVAAMTLPVGGMIMLVLYGERRNNLALFLTTSAVVVGFLVAAFVYFPDLFERGYIHYDQSISYWEQHLVAPWQLIRSHWGYGFDLPGTVNDDMSFDLGPAQMVVGLLALGYFLWHKFRVDKEALAFLGVTAVAIFLMIENPAVVTVWKILPGIKTILDFPWRLLGITGVGFSYLAAFLVGKFSRPEVLAVGLVGFVLAANRNHIQINLPLNYEDATFDHYQGTSTAGSNEYNPIFHKTDSLPATAPPVTVLSGGFRVEGAKSDAGGTRFQLVGTEAGVVRINRFYFPETEISGGEFKIISERQDNNFDDTGLMTLAVPPGGAMVVVRFGETPLRRLANIVSLASVLGVVLWICKDVVTGAF